MDQLANSAAACESEPATGGARPEPVDSAKIVELANPIAETANHPLVWVHMPVPVDRDDDAFFAPLKGLKLDPGTKMVFKRRKDG